MKSYTLDKLNEARDNLIQGDQLACMAVLDELITKHETMLEGHQQLLETYERQHHGTDLSGHSDSDILGDFCGESGG